MNRDEHIAYIHSPLEKLVREVMATSNHLGSGMEANMVSGYLMQSLFLQMTGAQEQKMKCICWELATDDLTYRYKRYYNGWSLSQCSTLEDKAHVYSDLMKSIHKKDCTYNLLPDEASKDALRDKVYHIMLDIFDNNCVTVFNKKKYDEFKSTFCVLHHSNFLMNEKTFFKNGNKDNPIEAVGTDSELFAIYSLLYEHRNRCAHNTPSYQLNLPHLRNLRDVKYQKYDNIYLYIATLLLIDEIFRALFLKYESLESLC